MQIYLDTANIEEVREMARLGVIRGVTTNPSLMAKESGATYKDTVQELCNLVHGHISAEVISLKAEEMVKEAMVIAEWSPNAVVKVPLLPEGLAAISMISRKELQPETTCRDCRWQDGCEKSLAASGGEPPLVRTNATLAFSTNQALLAAEAGATYVSPFVGRLDDIGHDGMAMVAEIVSIFDYYGIETQVIAASIRHALHITQAANAGAHIATVPYAVLKKSMSHPLTDLGVERFLADWKKANLKPE
ncbi:MAG: transaldolase family protein [Chloroflexi bacterium]|nr:transaldolase family protein [Chloroflexota bacterium]